MDIVSLIISLVSGAVGGNLGGAAVADKNLGTPANTVIGLLGGGGTDFLLKALGVLASSGVAGATAHAAGNGLDIGSILANIGASGVGGGVLTAVISLIKNAMDQK